MTNRAELLALIERAWRKLAEFAEERPGLWASLLGRRWVYSDEPLRINAQNLIAARARLAQLPEDAI